MKLKKAKIPSGSVVFGDGGFWDSHHPRLKLRLQLRASFTLELMFGLRWPRGHACLLRLVVDVWFWNFPKLFIHSWIFTNFNWQTHRELFFYTCKEGQKILTPLSHKWWIGHPCLGSVVLVDVILIPKLNPYPLKWTRAWKLKYAPAVFDCFTQTIK